MPLEIGLLAISFVIRLRSQRLYKQNDIDAIRVRNDSIKEIMDIVLFIFSPLDCIITYHLPNKKDFA